jgi:ATP-dependent DNA helicase RecG
MTLFSSIKSVHQPQSSQNLLYNSKDRERLSFDELVAMKLKFLIKSNEIAIADHIAVTSSNNVSYNSRFQLNGTSELQNLFASSLPFSLTNCQSQAVIDINSNLASPSRMERLLQGDVGSGKTIVTTMAMLRCVESGKLALLLAPTEILAKQHFEFLTEYAEKINKKIIEKQHKDDTYNETAARLALRGSHISPTLTVITNTSRTPLLNVDMITGAIKGNTRDSMIEKVKNGKINILVGTHALLSDNVVDAVNQSVGLVVIDEEQRFGVEQRSVLSNLTNTLYSTATPIPRSLMKVRICKHINFVLIFCT